MKAVKKHAVMMEYVIVAVLVAAAVVVAVMVFGRTVKTEFNVATTAMVDAKGAEDLQKQAKTKAVENRTATTDHAKAMNDYEGVKDAEAEGGAGGGGKGNGK